MKPDINKEMKLFNGESYKYYQQNSASIHCHSMKKKKKKKQEQLEQFFGGKLMSPHQFEQTYC